METAELLQRCRDGDELAWEALVRRHQGRVLATALTYVGEPEEACDVAQEAFIRIYRHLDSCRDPDAFRAWVVSLTRNACLDHLRRRKARPPARDVPAEEAVWLTAPDPDPEQALEATRRRALLWRALRQLSEINREIILLKDMQELPLEEIAAMLRLPLGTVKSRSHRARLELARAVEALQDEAVA